MGLSEEKVRQGGGGRMRDLRPGVSVCVPAPSRRRPPCTPPPTPLRQLKALGLFRGDTVRIKGKRNKDTVCIVLGDEGLDDGSIRMNKVVRKNIKVRGSGRRRGLGGG